MAGNEATNIARRVATHELRCGASQASLTRRGLFSVAVTSR
ncbi:MAG TPA: hypothetical protein VI306_07930 [Pyrinomonadaceae bacterium]